MLQTNITHYIRYDPVYALLCAPARHEKPCWEEERAKHHRRCTNAKAISARSGSKKNKERTQSKLGPPKLTTIRLALLAPLRTSMRRYPSRLLPPFQGNVYLVHQARRRLCRKRHAQAERDIMQTSDAGRFAVAPLVDRGEGREDEIYRAVDEGHVNTEKLDDGLAYEEGKGTNDGLCEEVSPTDE